MKSMKKVRPKEAVCACGHDHSTHEHHPESHDAAVFTAAAPSSAASSSDTSGITKTYSLENLGCANCAAKMEKRIAALPGINAATITFATKQLRVTAKNPDAFVEKMEAICRSIEGEVTLTPLSTRRKAVSEETSDHKGLNDKQKDLICLIGGVLLFIGGLILEKILPETYWAPAFFIGAYLFLGTEIVLEALKNLLHGQLFDENFLMSIATIGAFAIGSFEEAVGVMLFYRVGEFFEEVAVEKSRGQIMDAVDMRPETVNRVEGDTLRTIPAEDAEIGDILVIRPGDRIPLDGVVVDGESQIDTSPVTGEPVPVSAKSGDTVISGCVNTSGRLKIQVEKILEESMVSRILDAVENAAASKPKIDRFITRFARVYTPFVIALAVVTAIVPSLITGAWSHWVYTALTFLVISCPCALVLSVPLAFFSGIGAGSKRGILFKSGLSIEAISGISAVVMDKTGTVTRGDFTVQEVLPADDIEGDALLSLAASCEAHSTHPIGSSILSAAQSRGLTLTEPLQIDEIAGQGIIARIANKRVLCGNRKLMDTESIDLSTYHAQDYGTEVLLAIDGRFAGRILIADTLKEDSVSAVAAMKALGLSTAMLTGDSKRSAEAIARETGIDEVHAGLMPQDKLSILGRIRERVGAVMFVGDGINDAPVLAAADVGAAMGNGADAAIEAADVVFMTASLDAVPQSIRIAKATKKIAIQNVVFALVIKAAVMLLGLFGFASMWMAVFADSGVAILCVLNAIRVLYRKKI